MEIVQLIKIDGRQLVFEDDHEEQINILVSQEVADEYQMLLTAAEAEGESLIVERSSMEQLRNSDGL